MVSKFGDLVPLIVTSIKPEVVGVCPVCGRELAFNHRLFTTSIPFASKDLMVRLAKHASSVNKDSKLKIQCFEHYAPGQEKPFSKTAYYSGELVVSLTFPEFVPRMRGGYSES